MRDRVLSGGGDRDRPFGGFDGTVRPARGDQSPDVSHLRRGMRQTGSRCLLAENLSTRPSRRSDVDGSAVDDAPRHSDELACKGQTRPSANLRPRPQIARGTTPYLHTNPRRIRYRLTRYLFLDICPRPRKRRAKPADRLPGIGRFGRAAHPAARHRPSPPPHCPQSLLPSRRDAVAR